MKGMLWVPVETLERLATALESLEKHLNKAVDKAVEDVGLLSYDQVAARLGKDGKPISRRQVERLVRKYPERLKRIKLGSRSVRFRQADVDRFIAHQGGEKIGGRQL